MAIKLLFFARCADWMGRRELEIPAAGPARLSDILAAVPELKPILEHRENLKAVVNLEFADYDAEVSDGDEVAFLPPLSGG